MKKPDITKRDIKFFFFGVLFMFLFEMIYDWKDVKRAFTEGYNSTQEKVK
jgi:hypothetical protein